MAETWRVVLASGEVREVVTESGADGHRCAVVGNYHGWGTTPPSAIAAVVGLHGWPVREILAPGEMTRAELAAQLATATASVQQLRADVELATAQRDAEACRADNAEADWSDVTRELAVLRAQQAPLVACVDALRSAARDAGWRDADATGETLVAWVRRGSMLDAARIAMERGGEWVASAIRLAAIDVTGGE